MADTPKGAPNAGWGELLAQLLGNAARGFADAVPLIAGKGWERFHEVATDPELRNLIAVQIQKGFKLLEAELDRYEADPRSFVYNEFLAGTTIFLIARERLGDDVFFWDALEDAIRKSSLTTKASEAAGGAPHLSMAQRERIATGFDFFEGGRWILACDLLFKGLEGALWETAMSLGVIDENRFLTEPVPARPRYIKSANRLIGDDHLGKLRPSFRRFLGKAVFGAEGNDLRHGRGDQDGRRYACLAAVAIFGWLDHFADTRLMEELAHGVDCYVDAHAAALEAA